MKCNGKRVYPRRGKQRRPCDREPAWLIGTARVPYCNECAALYPKVAGKLVERVRIERGDSPTLRGGGATGGAGEPRAAREGSDEKQS
jgi:hypothetical protein